MAPGQPVAENLYGPKRPDVAVDHPQHLERQPFEKLLLSEFTVQRGKVSVSIEELAEDIAWRTLLALLTVRPVLDKYDTETGM